MGCPLLPHRVSNNHPRLSPAFEANQLCEPCCVSSGKNKTSLSFLPCEMRMRRPLRKGAQRVPGFWGPQGMERCPTLQPSPSTFPIPLTCTSLVLSPSAITNKSCRHLHQARLRWQMGKALSLLGEAGGRLQRARALSWVWRVFLAGLCMKESGGGQDSHSWGLCEAKRSGKGLPRGRGGRWLSWG